MSQTRVLELLRLLGGHATAAQLRSLARERNPADSLATSRGYMHKQLRRLQVWGLVERECVPSKHGNQLLYHLKPESSR